MRQNPALDIAVFQTFDAVHACMSILFPPVIEFRCSRRRFVASSLTLRRFRTPSNGPAADCAAPPDTPGARRFDAILRRPFGALRRHSVAWPVVAFARLQIFL
jgi:hypothetical protein